MSILYDVLFGWYLCRKGRSVLVRSEMKRMMYFAYARKGISLLDNATTYIKPNLELLTTATTMKLGSAFIMMSSIIHRPALTLITRPLQRSKIFSRHHLCLRLCSSNINIPDSDKSTRTSSSIIQTSAIVRRSEGATALDPIEDAITSCLTYYQKESSPSLSHLPMNAHLNILKYPQKDRESIGVASNLQRIMESFARSGVHCRRCWLQRKHCVCGTCVSLEQSGIPGVDRLFVLVSVTMHRLT